MHLTLRQTCSGLQVAVACGLLNVEAARTRAVQAAASGRRMLVVGIVRVPIAHCWYLGLGQRGEPLRWLSVHRWKRDAERQVDLVVQVDEAGDLDDETWEQLMCDLAARSDAELGAPQAAPPVVSRSRPQAHGRSQACGPAEGA